MNKWLGLLEIDCDAPDYVVVQGCAVLGFRIPEDVRWLRKYHSVDRPFSWWSLLFGKTPALKATCSCGLVMPEVRKFQFTLSTGEELDYDLGQCARCGTMYWELQE